MMSEEVPIFSSSHFVPTHEHWNIRFLKRWSETRSE